LSASEHRVFSDLALVLAMIPDLSGWSKEEKSAIRQIVQAKTGTDELRYVRLLQRRQKLRDGLRTIGSRDVTG
jgi:transketolase C-terminal domain/subunit